MRKLVLFSFVIIIALSAIVCYYSNLHKQLPKQTYLTNISELYSLFTPYMKNTVNYRLQAINCQPNKYYYEDSSICFVCDDMHACFGYTYTLISGKKLMNPKRESYLKNVKRISIKVIDFYQKGLASDLHCNIENDKTLKCEKGIKFILEDGDVKLSIDNTSQFSAVADKLCNYLGEENLVCENFNCSCGVYHIFLKENKIFVYEGG